MKWTTEDLPLLGSYDVAVCGGGVSGIMAAAAAARQGASVLLLEQAHFLGGTATQSFVSPISRIQKNGHMLLAGLPMAFLKDLEAMGGTDLSYPSGHAVFDTELYKLCAQRLVLKSGASVRFGMTVIGSLLAKEEDGTRVTHLVCHGKEGTSLVAAKCVVDCSGDADVARCCGLPVLVSAGEDGEQQPMTLWFRMSGVDLSHLYHLYPSQANVRHFDKEVRELLEIMPDAPQFGGPWVYSMLREGFATINLTRFSGNGADSKDLTAAALTMREDIFRVIAYLREKHPAFHNARLSDTGVTVGVRETYRIDGLYTLTKEDVLNGRDFPDAVAWGAHPVDMHRAAGNGQQLVDVKIPYGIPFGTLVPKGSKNLLAAGRTISATREALATARVQGTSMMTGQGAGIAAAACAQKGISLAALVQQGLSFPRP